MTALALALSYLGTLAFAAFIWNRAHTDATDNLNDRVLQLEQAPAPPPLEVYSSLAIRVQQLEESVEPLILAAGLRRK